MPLPDDMPTPAGEYVLAPDALYGIPPLRITFAVPTEGWESWGPGVVTTDPGERGGVGIGFANIANVFVDPCHWETLGLVEPAVGPSVDDLAQALTKQPRIHGDRTEGRLGRRSRWPVCRAHDR